MPQGYKSDGNPSGGAFKKGNTFSPKKTWFTKNGVKGRSTRFKKGHKAKGGHRYQKGEFAQERHWNWKGGISEYPQDHILRKHRCIILIHNPDCEICGNPAREVHHKDFTKSNHKLSNLVGLCNSCHQYIHRGNLRILG